MKCQVNTMAHSGEVKIHYIYGRKYKLCDLCAMVIQGSCSNDKKLREYYRQRGVKE